MSKRPTIDLLSLTSEQAAPMPEAIQRMPATMTKQKPKTVVAEGSSAVRTENLEALAFKVPAAFRKRFRQCAVSADLKLNELLFEALDAWQEKTGHKH
jgi:hypothetical protein